MWGYSSLEGRREPDVSYYDLPAKPEKPAKDAPAVVQARYKKALKAYNKKMRPAQGTALHAIWEAYYLQKVPGAWHPPMAWRHELPELWETRPGQIALSGRQHMPDPKSLAEVWVEELVSLDLSFLPGGHPRLADGSLLRIGGTPDLVAAQLSPAVMGAYALLHLYDYKSTVSVDEYAKTPAELLEDEQAAIYSLAVMQRHGLQSLDCTWLYFQTDDKKPARAMPVRFTMTREHAQSVVARHAARALEMAKVQAVYLAEKPGLLGGRLKVLNSLDTNDMACDNFAGCPYHTKRGGICTPKKSSFGEALRKAAVETKKTQGRRDAAKAARQAEKANGAIDIMMTPDQKTRLATLSKEKEALDAKGEKFPFAKGQELVKLKKLADAEGGDAEEGAAEGEAPAVDSVEVAGSASPGVVAPTVEKPKASSKPAKAEAPDEGGGVLVSHGATSVQLPKSSPLFKAIVKICKAQEALNAAMAGE